MDNTLAPRNELYWMSIENCYQTKMLLEKMAEYLRVRYIYEEQQPPISPQGSALVEDLNE